MLSRIFKYLFAMMLVVGVQGLGNKGVHAQTTYTIGAITLFGDAAGEAQIDILNYVADQFNSQPGISKRANVEFQFADGGCDSATALASYEQLYSEGIRLFEGGLCSGETLGFAPRLEADGAVAVNATSSSNALEGISPNLKILSYKNSALAGTIGTEMCNQGSSTAIITETAAFTADLRSQVLDFLAACNLTPVALADVSFDQNTTPAELEALVNQVKATGAEAVFLNTSFTTGSIALLDAVEASNWSPGPQLYGVADNYSGVVLAAAPTVVPGMVLAGAPPITDPKACEILADIEASNPGTLASVGTFYAWTTYEAGVLISNLAVQLKGNVEKIVHALSTRTFQDLAGISTVHGGNIYFGDEVFAQGVETFPFVVQPDLSVSPPSCP